LIIPEKKVGSGFGVWFFGVRKKWGQALKTLITLG